jgi:hypothetical protein
MMETPRSYSQRRDVVAQKLEPYFHISALVPTNTKPAFDDPEGLFENSWMCSWGDPETLTSRTLFVYVHEVADGERKAERIREMMAEEAPPDPDLQRPDADAYEMARRQPGEFAFVLNYLGCLTVIVGKCVIEIMPNPISLPLSEIADTAADILRAIGCSRYVNDFQPPAIDANRDFGGWTTADGLIYDPRTPPQP